MMELFLKLTLVFSFFHRKRSISEVQLMHNVREHKQVGERQDWLQEKLKDIIVASAKPQHGQSRNIKNLLPNDVLGSNMWKSWIQPIPYCIIQTEAQSKICGSDSATFFSSCYFVCLSFLLFIYLFICIIYLSFYYLFSFLFMFCCYVFLFIYFMLKYLNFNLIILFTLFSNF